MESRTPNPQRPPLRGCGGSQTGEAKREIKKTPPLQTLGASIFPQQNETLADPNHFLNGEKKCRAAILQG